MVSKQKSLSLLCNLPYIYQKVCSTMCIGKSFDAEGLTRHMYLTVELFKRNL